MPDTGSWGDRDEEHLGASGAPSLMMEAMMPTDTMAPGDGLGRAWPLMSLFSVRFLPAGLENSPVDPGSLPPPPPGAQGISPHSNQGP